MRTDRIRNNLIRKKLDVVSMINEIENNQLKWFELEETSQVNMGNEDRK